MPVFPIFNLRHGRDLESTTSRRGTFSLLFSVTIIIFAHLVLRPSRNSDLGSRGRPFSSLPATLRALHLYHDKTSALSSLVDSRRILPTHAIISALDSSSCQSRIRAPYVRRFEPMTLTISGVRGYPLKHRGDLVSIYTI